MGFAARARAADFAWPRVAQQVTSVYERAIEAPEPAGRLETLRAKAGLVQGDLTRSRRARRLPSLEPRPVIQGSRASRVLASARRIALAVSAIVGLFLAFLALKRVGVDNVVTTLVHSSPIWVLVALGLFSTSMLLRAVSWFQILRAALPESPIQETDDPERDVHRGADVRHAAGEAR